MAIRSGRIIINEGDYVIDRIQGVSGVSALYEIRDEISDFDPYEFAETELFEKPHTPVTPAGFYKEVFTTLRRERR